MNRKDRMNEQILKHGFRLQEIFMKDTRYDYRQIGPVALAKAVHRLEVKAHRMAEDYCNGLIDSEEWLEKKEKSILKSLNQLLNFTAQGIPVFVNSDPRGYALKIDDTYVREHDLDIYKDWGGYGILAPEFDGRG
jgi:hypothetical protein